MLYVTIQYTHLFSRLKKPSYNSVITQHKTIFKFWRAMQQWYAFLQGMQAFIFNYSFGDKVGRPLCLLITLLQFMPDGRRGCWFSVALRHPGWSSKHRGDTDGQSCSVFHLLQSLDNAVTSLLPPQMKGRTQRATKRQLTNPIRPVGAAFQVQSSHLVCDYLFMTSFCLVVTLLPASSPGSSGRTRLLLVFINEFLCMCV